jgi:hypothetical protein
MYVACEPIVSDISRCESARAFVFPSRPRGPFEVGSDPMLCDKEASKSHILFNHVAI